jgi:hypothetical protein
MSWLAGESVRRGNEEKYVNNANSLRAAPFDMARDYFSISSKVELAQKMSDWHTNFT